MLIGLKIPRAADYSLFFLSQQSALTFLGALALFLFFQKWHIKTSKWINLAASATFGVYLIHDSEIIRPFLWHEVFRNAQYQDSVFLIPYSIIVIAAVYGACTCVDLLRQYTVEKLFMRLTIQLSPRIVVPIEKLIAASKNYVFGSTGRTSEDGEGAADTDLSRNISCCGSDAEKDGGDL